MAIRQSSVARLINLEHVSKSDDALDLEASKYDEYLKTADKKHLVFKAGIEPTIFSLNFEHSGKQSRAIKDNMIGSSNEEGKPQVTLGSWQYEVVSLSLKGIKNPADLPLEECLIYKTDESGKRVADEVMAKLERHGVIGEIFSLYSALHLKSSRPEAKNS